MGDKEPSIDEIDSQITKVERVMDGMSLEDLTNFSKQFEEKINSNVNEASDYIDKLVCFNFSIFIFIYIYLF